MVNIPALDWRIRYHNKYRVLFVPWSFLWITSSKLFIALSSFHIFSKKYFPVKTVDDELNINAKSHIGKECTVVSIENSIVKVRLGESLWFAKGCEMIVGQKVQIVDVDSSTLIVEPSNKD